MKRRYVLLVHILLAALVLTVLLPGGKPSAPPGMFLGAVALSEGVYLLHLRRSHDGAVPSLLIAIFWAVLLLWEIYTTRLGLANVILVPSPEDVFHVFLTHRVLMIRGIFSSLQLLGLGFAIGLTAGVGLGLTAGWFPLPRDVLAPVARVMSPIPPIIYSPYVVALMPSFRSAALVILVLGIFWPTFMNMMAQAQALDRRIIDAARMMNVKGTEMVFLILLPSVMPGLFSGLRVSLSTSFLLLTMAEMTGAASGLGYFIKNYSDYANYTNVVAGIFLVGAVVTALNKMIGAAERRLVRWKG